MSVKSIISVAAISAVTGLVAFPGIANANIVQNPGFETPVVTFGSFTTFQAGQTIGEGWVVGSGNVDVVRNTLWQPRSGFQSLDLDGVLPGSIYQDLVTVPNQLYTLDFWLAGNMFNIPTTKRMEVFWGDVSVGVFEYSDPSGNPSMPRWDAHMVANLLARGTTTRLSFVSLTNAQSGSSWGAAIDDVSVVLVPTPSTAALIGLAGLMASRRRRSPV